MFSPPAEKLFAGGRNESQRGWWRGWSKWTIYTPERCLSSGAYKGGKYPAYNYAREREKKAIERERMRERERSYLQRRTKVGSTLYTIMPSSSSKTPHLRSDKKCKDFGHTQYYLYTLGITNTELPKKCTVEPLLTFSV